MLTYRPFLITSSPETSRSRMKYPSLISDRSTHRVKKIFSRPAENQSPMRICRFRIGLLMWPRQAFCLAL
jgi:hypothetical protein